MRHTLYSAILLLIIFALSCNDQDKKLSRPSQTSKPGQISPPPATPSTSWKEFLLPLDELAPAFKNEREYFASNDNINERFKLIRLLKGTSSSQIFLVALKENDERRILKILPEIWFKNVSDDASYREIYFSQLLSELKSNKFLAHNYTASIFFPHYYGFGFVGSKNPFDLPEESNKYYPIFITEYITGITLSDLALNSDKAQELGYNYTQADPKVIFSILLQISIALLNAQQGAGFIHNDLHAENIILAKSQTSVVFETEDQFIRPVGPQVKIIDLERGETQSMPAISIKAFKTLGRQILGVIGPTEAFFKAINPDKSWIKLSLTCYYHSPNMDMFMLNIMLHTFAKKFKSKGFIVEDQYFSDINSLSDFLIKNADKFGLSVSK